MITSLPLPLKTVSHYSLAGLKLAVVDYAGLEILEIPILHGLTKKKSSASWLLVLKAYATIPTWLFLIL